MNNGQQTTTLHFPHLLLLLLLLELVEDLLGLLGELGLALGLLGRQVLLEARLRDTRLFRAIPPNW